MKKILFAILLLSNVCLSQTYTATVVQIRNAGPDTLWQKNSIQDTLWRKQGNTYSVAYVAKQWAYFPFFQHIDNPTTLAGYGISDAALSSHTHAYNTITGLPVIPTNNNQLSNGAGYLIASDIAGKQNAISLTTTGTGAATFSNSVLNIPTPATGLGYTLSVQALTSSPADAQTIYFGQLPKAPVTAAGNSKIYIRKAGTIKMAQVYCYSGTAGTNESWVMNIRLNNTTDTQIASVSQSTNERIFSNSSLNIAVVAGDYIEIKCVNPTWATNPLTTIFGGYIYIE